MGWPAFGLLLFVSYRYLPRRLTQLGAPRATRALIQAARAETFAWR